MFGRCSICRKFRWLRFITPADPPFFPEGGGWHCARCEKWLVIWLSER